MQHSSLRAALEKLDRLYARRLMPEQRSLAELYEAADRDLTQPTKNRIWLSNAVSSLKHHDLVRPIYASQSGKRCLAGIRLTDKGRDLLDEFQHPADNVPAPTDPSLESLVQHIQRYARENPSVEVQFEIKLRREAT